MVPIIDPEDDYLTIAAAEEQMALTHDARQKELHEAHTKLKRESSPLFSPPTRLLKGPSARSAPPDRAYSMG